MIIRDIKDLDGFIAGDDSLLREILHPSKLHLALGYSLAHAVVGPGKRTKPHHLKSSEVYFILEGHGIMEIDGERAEVMPGQAIYIPPHSVQCIKNRGGTDLVFLCIVDPAWRPEDEAIDKE